ncbi:MAG: YggT family protein [Gammaproteobacteria bacterium]|jgi:YggT family protein|nr:YggT family protein [Gammaproteobacteria bacterium]MBT3488137.1 YggT family protein [Gammaproteobacteria bacterium]MBT3719205.1 YggT family protein [Gammaproteobacteria bacterium]MBT3844299.1 YggT family protein [Gammaproteobacteria bacterium]MBT3894011.1 YggT family protein [Gammaproteobacteria bacterium]
MSNTSSAGLFFLQMLFSIAILFTLLRFLFQLLRVDYYNPISQMVTRFTDPLLQPLRSLIPSNRTIDGASLVVLFLLQYLHLFIITQLRDLDANPLGLAILASAELLSLATSLLFWSILILAVLSWFQPHTQHPGVSLLNQITDPLMRPIRRWMPPAGGVDFSPILAMLAIKMAEFILIAPLQDIAAHLLQG